RAQHVVEPSRTGEVVPGDERLSVPERGAQVRDGGGWSRGGEAYDEAGDEAGDSEAGRQSGSRHGRGALVAKMHPSVGGSLSSALQSANKFRNRLRGNLTRGTTDPASPSAGRGADSGTKKWCPRGHAPRAPRHELRIAARVLPRPRRVPRLTGSRCASRRTNGR